MRLPLSDNRNNFAITGTQTGELRELGPEHYTIVSKIFPEENKVIAARGRIKPSSECMTHGMVYALNEEANFVFHVHSPEIWKRGKEPGILETRREVEYGTPEMALEVERLFRESDVRGRRIFSMLGHEDGIVSFGRTAEQAGRILIDQLRC